MSAPGTVRPDPGEPGKRRPAPGRLVWRWVPLAAAGGVGIILLTSVLLIRSTMHSAASATFHGQGHALFMAVHLAWRKQTPPIQAAQLQEALRQHHSDGLRYLALLDPGGDLLIEAGEALLTSTAANGVVHKDGRVRMIRPLHPPGPPGGMSPAGGPPSRAWLEHAFLKAPHGVAAPQGRGSLAPHPNLVLEFEPRHAQQLSTQASTLLVIALVTMGVVLLMALAIGRAMRGREALLVQLQERQRLAELGKMSAVLAHELRNPLTSLKGHAQLLEELLPADSRQREKAGRVVSEAVRLEQLMGNLLSFVRSGEIRRRPADPRALLNGAAEEVDPSRIQLQLQEAPDSWSLDPERIHQALVNVLRNALQASVGQEQVLASCSVMGDDLLFTVRDHGEGLPEEDAGEIFKSFFTGRVKGTGLGLTITRQVVTAHGGSIIAQNDPGGGAVFRLIIPRKMEQE